MSKQYRMYGIAVLLLCLTLAACGGKDVSGTGDKTVEAGLSWQEQYDLGVRLLNEGNYEEAVLAFLAVIDIDPKNVDAYTALAEVYMQMEQLDNAQSILQRGFDNCGEENYEHFILMAEQFRLELNLSGTGSGGQNGGADQDDSGLNITPDMDYDDLCDLGEDLYEEGKLDQAIAAYEKALEKDPSDYEAYCQLAQIYLDQNNREKAKDILQKGVTACAGHSFDMNRLTELILDNGFMIDAAGNVVEFDEELYIANFTAKEKLDYYFEKQRKLDPYVFDNMIVFNGKEIQNVTVQDVVDAAPGMNWPEMKPQRSDISEVYGSGSTRSGGALVNVFRWLDSEYTHFTALDLGQTSNQHDDPFWYESQGVRPYTGVLDIHLGDTVVDVLTSMGLVDAEKIAALLLDPNDRPQSDFGSLSFGMEPSRTVSPGEGEKLREMFYISYVEMNGCQFLDVKFQVYTVSDYWMAQELTMRFELGDEYLLRQVSIEQTN